MPLLTMPFTIRFVMTQLITRFSRACLTFRIQRTGAAAAADSGPLE